MVHMFCRTELWCSNGWFAFEFGLQHFQRPKKKELPFVFQHLRLPHKYLSVSIMPSLLLLLSQAIIIESQVNNTSSSHTWLGQKQLLQRSYVFFTRLFTLIRQCAAMRNALDSKWQSFALNKERGARGTMPVWIILELEVNHIVLWVSFAVC